MHTYTYTYAYIYIISIYLSIYLSICLNKTIKESRPDFVLVVENVTVTSLPKKLLWSFKELNYLVMKRKASAT